MYIQDQYIVSGSRLQDTISKLAIITENTSQKNIFKNSGDFSE